MARRSPVRDAVRELLQHEDHRAWLIEELMAEVQRGGRQTTSSSVFRAVVALERAGAVQRVDLGDGRHRYEATGDHHEHIRCERCGQVAEIAGCLIENVATRVKGLTGFDVTDHRLVLQGLCPDCLSSRRTELRRRLADLD
jgi:Fur family transcriptional regulator, ferric uptake regulator